MHRLLILAFAAASLALASAAPETRAAVVDAAPTWPIPADAPAGPPPIPNLPTATDVLPPPAEIADPVTPAAACGAWHLQSYYGDRWPAGSSWWEYRCSYYDAQYYNACTGTGACDAFCPYCYWDTQEWTDYFYWDGSNAVFYGEAYSDSVAYDTGDSFSSAAWWDETTSKWYRIDSASTPPANVPPTASFSFTCSGLSCVFDGSGSFDPDGTIYSNDYYWKFGDASEAGGRSTQDHTYAASGTFTVTLTVTDNGGATATVSQAVTVQGPPNAPPTAAFTFSCTGLSCSLNDSGSTDSDGAIASYSWAFGDGAGATGATASHTYGHAGDFSVSLTVTDDRGASATVSKEVTVSNLAPTATFTVTCSGLRCTVDGSGSADGDGTIATYGWSFGDGAGGSGRTTVHDYPKAGSYTLTLTVTDNDGASAATSQRINPISLSARGYKQSSQQKVDLSWNGVAGTSFDVYRDGGRIAAVQGTTYTDVAPKGPGSHTYTVCAAAGATCSSNATVTF